MGVSSSLNVTVKRIDFILIASWTANNVRFILNHFGNRFGYNIL